MSHHVAVTGGGHPGGGERPVAGADEPVGEDAVPVLGDPQGGLAHHVHDPAVALGAEPVRAGLHHPAHQVGAVGGVQGHEGLARVLDGAQQLAELVPGGGGRQAQLPLEHLAVVEGGHRPRVLGDAPHGISHHGLSVGAGVVLVLVLLDAVAGQVHQGPGERELRQGAQLHLGDVGPASRGHGREDLGVAAVVAAGDPGGLHADPVLGLVVDVGHLLQVLEPGPVGEGDRSVGRGDRRLVVDGAGVRRRAGREGGGCQRGSRSDQRAAPAESAHGRSSGRSCRRGGRWITRGRCTARTSTMRCESQHSAMLPRTRHIGPLSGHRTASIVNRRFPAPPAAAGT